MGMSVLQNQKLHLHLSNGGIEIMMEERDDFSYLSSTEDNEYKRFGIRVDKIEQGYHSELVSLMTSI